LSANSDVSSGRLTTERGGETCVVIHPVLPHATGERDRDSCLEEGIGLAAAIDLSVRHGEAVTVSKPRPATLLGKGTIDRLRQLVSEEPSPLGSIDVIIIDAILSPIQQRNLEREWKRKVIDRTGLILEIFGARARTKEGRLQVELAALTYQRSRLVRSWTHLERQRGGAGFMGGPGETQIETDRRLIDQRITHLKKGIADVKRTRELHRTARCKVPYPIIVLVGYTNAGKSTLFNRLTDSEVDARDALFATLDPTMREIRLPSGREAILSDTVGFISNLPHELVNAFHATLEEVTEAELILHVRDISHPDADAQRTDVQEVLAEIGVAEGNGTDTIVEVLNKVDALEPDERTVLENRARRGNTPAVLLSAKTGEGCRRLLEVIEEKISALFEILDVDLPYADGSTLAWLYDHGDVLRRVDGSDGISVTVRLSPADAERYRRGHR